MGDAIRRVYVKDGEAMQAQNASFDVSMLLGGQIKGRNMRLFELYSAGNFIEATPDTPFLQIGEHKYGKPILDRVVRSDMALEDGVKVVLISMDSTLRSNLGVGLPVDLLVYRRDSLQVELRRPDGRRQLFPPGPRPLVRRAPRSLPDPPPPRLDGRVSICGLASGCSVRRHSSPIVMARLVPRLSGRTSTAVTEAGLFASAYLGSS